MLKFNNFVGNCLMSTWQSYSTKPSIIFTISSWLNRWHYIIPGIHNNYIYARRTTWFCCTQHRKISLFFDTVDIDKTCYCSARSEIKTLWSLWVLFKRQWHTHIKNVNKSSWTLNCYSTHIWISKTNIFSTSWSNRW